LAKTTGNALLWDISDWTPYRMWSVGRHAAQRIRDLSLKQYGLKPAGWRALANIGSREPLSSKELSQVIGLDPVQTSRAVDQLVRKQLISRRVDEEDRRRVKLSLSRKGRRIYDAIAPVAEQIENDLLSLLSVSERRAFIRLLNKVEQRADEMGN
jgi:DNA-binding MarR family transcriptional regulator